MTSEAAAAALDYSRWGWSVVPVHTIGSDGRCTCGAPRCVSPGKHPRVRWEAAQRESPSTARVEEWWARWPEANVGIVTGRASGLAVLDVDPRHDGDETLARLVDRHGVLPPTPEVETGGSGRHLYFAYVAEPGHTVPSGPVGPGLDLKADGGLVIAPPSVHASGARYRWTRPPTELPLGALPAWAYLRAGRVTAGPAGEPGSHPPRTSAEHTEFAALWAAVGIDLAPGDRYYLCPFHDDHHPSLHVDADGCRWYCFGCGEGGGPGRLRRLVAQRSGPAAVEAARATAPDLEHARVPATWMQWPTLQPGGAQAVVGESEHQEIIEAAAGGRTWHGAAVPVVTVRLRREPTNLLDPEAVVVELGGQPVGYLPATDAARFHDVIERLEAAGAPATARARLTGGWERGPGGRGWFGVEVDVELPPQPRDPDTPFLPPGPPVAVVGEEGHQETLRTIVADAHAASATAELVVRGDSALAVLIDGEEVGALGPANSTRYRPLVETVTAAGLPSTCAASVIEGGQKVEVYVLLPSAEVAGRLVDAT